MDPSAHQFTYQRRKGQNEHGTQYDWAAAYCSRERHAYQIGDAHEQSWVGHQG